MSLIFPKKEILYAPMLGTFGGGAGRGFGQFGGSAVLAGEVILEGNKSTSQRTVNWTVPAGVTSISVVTVGGGGAGIDIHDGMGGGGGALAWSNNVSVSTGDVITLVAGNGGWWAGLTTTRTGTAGPSGGESHIKVNGGSAICVARGGNGGNHTLYSTINQWYTGAAYLNADGGGAGGQPLRKASSRSGGSGAGGYTGQGGRAGSYQYDISFGATDGTGGGGGGGEAANGGSAGFATGGGGVGIYGLGNSGVRSIWNGSAVYAAGGGSGGGQSIVASGLHTGTMPHGGSYGGGGSGAHSSDYPGSGEIGVVRVIWGDGSFSREFPSTNVDLASSGDNVTYL